MPKALRDDAIKVARNCNPWQTSTHHSQCATGKRAAREFHMKKFTQVNKPPVAPGAISVEDMNYVVSNSSSMHPQKYFRTCSSRLY